LSAFLSAGRVKHTNVDVVDRTKNLWGLVVIYSHIYTIFYEFSLVQLSYFGCGNIFFLFSCKDPNRFRKIKFYYYKIDKFEGKEKSFFHVYINFLMRDFTVWSFYSMRINEVNENFMERKLHGWETANI